MSFRITYVTTLDLNGIPTKPHEARKRSNTLVDFKLETMSPSPSKIGNSCLRPQGSSFGANKGEDQVSKWRRWRIFEVCDIH
jgi:hypothetical protein